MNFFDIQYSTHFPKPNIFGIRDITGVLTWCQEPGSTPTEPRVSLFTLDSGSDCGHRSRSLGVVRGTGVTHSERRSQSDSDRAGAVALMTTLSLSLYSDISERGASILCLQLILHFHC